MANSLHRPVCRPDVNSHRRDNVITRKQYMNREFTHQEYYGQFSSPNVVASVAAYIGPKNLLASTDEHLNDIPLRIWDNGPWFGMQRSISDMNKSTHCEADRRGNQIITSLSDKVCALKAAARKWIEENKDG